MRRILQEDDCKERSLAKQIQQAQQRVHEALLDNLNSKAALDALLDLVKDTNKYLLDRRGNAQGEQSGMHEKQCLPVMWAVALMLVASPSVCTAAVSKHALTTFSFRVVRSLIQPKCPRLTAVYVHAV